MVSVDALGKVRLNWQAPTENEDGTRADVGGFRLYYGETSGRYESIVKVDNPKASARTLELKSGTYFVTMTAVSRGGLESEFSNEVKISVR